MLSMSLYLADRVSTSTERSRRSDLRPLSRGSMLPIISFICRSTSGWSSSPFT